MPPAPSAPAVSAATVSAVMAGDAVDAVHAVNAIAPVPTGSRSAASQAWRTFGLTALAVFLVSLDATVVVAAYPALRAEFAAASPALLSWTLNAYTILYAALLVPAGRLADLVGRRRLFVAGVALFTLASALCGLAPEPMSLIAARSLQAVGGALLTPASLALLLRAFPAEQRAAAIGLWSAVGALAAAVGPAAGSWIIENAGWRWVFLINVPVGIAAWWRARHALDESTSAETGAKLDVPGTALLAFGVGALALALVQSESWGWRDPAILVSLVCGVALLAAFVAWARGRPSAALDLDLFADRRFAFVSVATVVFGVAFSALFLASFLFQMGVWGWSQSLAGLALTPGPLIVMPVAIAGGRLAGRIGHRPLLVAGGLLFALGQSWLAWRAGTQPDYLGTWLPSQLMVGTAIGLVLPSLSAAAVVGLAPGRYGVGGGVNNALRQMGGAIGAALAVGLVGGSAASLENFRVLFALLAACGVAVALLSLPVDTRPPTRRPA